MAKKNKNGPTRPRPCGNWVCNVSSCMLEVFTFGRGKLDPGGYWEIPCEDCARDYERRNPGEIAWPFDEATRKKFQEMFDNPTKL